MQVNIGVYSMAHKPSRQLIKLQNSTGLRKQEAVQVLKNRVPVKEIRLFSEDERNRSIERSEINKS